MSDEPKTRKTRRTIHSKTHRAKDQIIKAYNAGKSLHQIGREVGVASTTIGRFLDRIADEKQQIAQFRTSRVDVLSSIQSRALAVQSKILDDLGRDGFLDSLTPKEKANMLPALVIANGNAYDKERLETGQSTQNISTLSRMIDQQVSTLYKRRVIQPVVVEPLHNVDEKPSD